MNIDAEGPLHAVVSTRAELLRYHEPERIQGYCRGCEKHGVYWSCPPFAQAPLEHFPEWTHVVVLCRRIPVAPGTTWEQLLARFQASRVVFGAIARELEAKRPGVTALVAGHCAGCTDCTRGAGLPCRAPARMRYSLEAVGFDVSGLAEALAGIKLHWPKSGVPDYLTTVGALLCPDALVAAELCAAAHAVGCSRT